MAEERCEGEEVREVCRQVVRQRVQWSKRCLLPPDMKHEMAKEILRDTSRTNVCVKTLSKLFCKDKHFLQENEIEGKRSAENITEKLPKSKIVRLKVPANRGQKNSRRIVSSPQPRNGEREDGHRTKVNFKFLLEETTTSRPTGVPYVYADRSFNDDEVTPNRIVKL